MKDEAEPIADDEWLVRLVWSDFMKPPGITITPSAFEPKPRETTGISLFRLDCLQEVIQALEAIPDPEKRQRYGIVKIPISLLHELGLSAKPDPISAVTGHVIVPELNITEYKAKKAHFTPIKLSLAEAATKNVLYVPHEKS